MVVSRCNSNLIAWVVNPAALHVLIPVTIPAKPWITSIPLTFSYTGFRSETITFDSDAGTSETFNKVGAVDYDGSTTNIIQIVSADDAASEIYYYSVAPYTSDTTP